MSSSGRRNSLWQPQPQKSMIEDKVAATVGDAWKCFYPGCRVGATASSCQNKLKNHIEHFHPEANVQAYLAKSRHWFETTEKPKRTATEYETQKEMELDLSTTGGVFQEDSAQTSEQGRRSQFDLSGYAQTLEEVSLSSSRIRSGSCASSKCKELEGSDQHPRLNPHPKIQLDVAVSRDDCLKIPNTYFGSSASQSGASEGSDSGPRLDFWKDEYEHAYRWAKKSVFPGLVVSFDVRLKDLRSSTPSARTRTSASGSRSSDGGRATYAPSSTPSEAPYQRDKRKRGGDEEDDESRSSPGGHLRPTRSSSTGNGHTRQFACLYYKYNSCRYSRGKYKSCPLGYAAMNRLKQHLSNVHAPKFYCVRCKKTFGTEEDRNSHHLDSHQQCSETGLDPYFDEMIITTQKRKAMEKKQRDDSNISYWFKMWDAFFPNSARPHSPYKISDQMTLIQEIAEHQRNTIHQRYREAYPRRNVPDAVLSEIIDVIMTDFIGEYRSRTFSVSGSRNGIAQTPDNVAGVISDGESLPATDTAVFQSGADAQYVETVSEALWEDGQVDDFASDLARDCFSFPTEHDLDDGSHSNLHDFRFPRR